MSSPRRILVTGAASGIGACLVRRLEAQGLQVIALDRAPIAGGVQCDLSNEAAITEQIGAIDGVLDGIAHVAGVPGTAPSELVAAVNILAIRRTTDLLLDRLNPHSSIVVVSSVTAHRCAWTDAEARSLLDEGDDAILAALNQLSGPDAYAASKRLANAWTAQQSATLLDRAIRVNAVSPGPIETPIFKDFEESMGVSRLQAAADCVGRHGKPDEVAAAIAFLLEPDASWVNGINLACDGGFSNARLVAAAAIAAPPVSEPASCN